MYSVLAIVTIFFIATLPVGTSGVVRQGVEWEITGPFLGEPTVAGDGTLRIIVNNPGDLVGRSPSELRCYQPNGHIQWEHQLNETCSGFPVGEDGTTYFSTFNSTNGPSLSALDGTGSVKWTFTTPNFIGGSSIQGVSSPTVTEGGMIVFTVQIGEWPNQSATQDLGLVFVISADGTLLWKASFNEWHVRFFGTLDNPGLFLIATNQNGITALDSHGATRWAVDMNELGSRIIFGPVVRNGTIFVGMKNMTRNVPDEVWALNSGGDVLWRCQMPLGAAYLQGGELTSIASDRYGTVYAITQPGQEVSAEFQEQIGANMTYGKNIPAKFVSLTPNGTLRWSKDVDEIRSEIITDPEGAIYLNTGNDVLALNSDGNIFDRYGAAPGVLFLSLTRSADGGLVLTKMLPNGHRTISISSGMPQESVTESYQKNMILTGALLSLVAIIAYLTYVKKSKGRKKSKP